MNRHELHSIQQVREYPCVTITMPTRRTSPQNKQDSIRVKNLVKQASERLLGEFGKRDIEPVLTRLEELATCIDYGHLLEGLILFASRGFSKMSVLPFLLKERVVIDETFHTRDLVFALNRTMRYWTLVLSEKPTRLYEGIRDRLTEINNGGFPMIHQGPGGEQPLPGGYGVRKSAYRDERHRQFFRQVDKALKRFLADDPLPLVVVGVDRFLSFFTEITRHKNSIFTTLTGSHDKTSSHELSKLVWPLVEAKRKEQHREILSMVSDAISERKLVSTVEDVWVQAKAGRGRILVVEQDFHYTARLDKTGRKLVPVEGDIDASDVIDDAVDEIIETVLNKKGQVVFVDNGELEEHQRIVLILRY